MNRIVELKLNDALFNAGLLGFIRICKHNNLDISYKEDNLTFSSAILENFSALYLDELISTYELNTIFFEIYHRFHNLSELNTERYQMKFDDNIKYILDKLKRSSYLSAYEIIRKRGEPYPFEDIIKQVRGLDSDKEIYEKLSEILNKMQEYRDVFILKDIAYTKIQPFWTNVAFLNKTQNREEFLSTYEDTFTLPAYNYVPMGEKNPKLTCCQCQIPLTKLQAYPMSWICNVGVDIKRKTSHYWNFNPDTHLCPVCNLIYSCSPLGFIIKGSEAIFINKNQNIEDIIYTNSLISASELESKSDIYYQVLTAFLKKDEPEAIGNEITNIQIVRHSREQYFYHILSNKHLEIFRDCSKTLFAISKVFCSIDGEIINLFRIVLDYILRGNSLYPLINKIIYDSSKHNKKIWYLQNLIQLQTHIYLKGDVEMNNKMNYAILGMGNNLRNSMLSDERNEKKITNLTFHLLNHLKAKNPEKFADNLLRQYMSLNMAIPPFITDIFTNEESFITKGYSFVAGLNGSLRKEN